MLTCSIQKRLSVSINSLSNINGNLKLRSVAYYTVYTIECLFDCIGMISSVVIFPKLILLIREHSPSVVKEVDLGSIECNDTRYTKLVICVVNSYCFSCSIICQDKFKLIILCKLTSVKLLDSDKIY